MDASADGGGSTPSGSEAPGILVARRPAPARIPVAPARVPRQAPEIAAGWAKEVARALWDGLIRPACAEACADELMADGHLELAESLRAAAATRRQVLASRGFSALGGGAR